MKKFFKQIAYILNINGREWTVFFLSLLLAFFIWLFHNLSFRYQDYLTIPVVAKCNIEGHADRSTNKFDVVARCRTTGYNILKIKRLSKRSPVEVPFSRMHPISSEYFYVTLSELQEYTHLLFGEGTSIEFYLTDTLFFTIPLQTHKRVPVRPVHEIDLKPQYMLTTALTTSPDSVTIYGEPYSLEKVDYVYTEPIKARKVDSHLHGVVRLEKNLGIRYSDESVRYSASVQRYVTISKTVNVGTRNTPSDRALMIYPSSAQVNFRCKFPYKKNPVDSARFFIDYEDFASSLSGRCVVKVEGLSDDIINYEISPEVFECVAE